MRSTKRKNCLSIDEHRQASELTRRIEHDLASLERLVAYEEEEPEEISLSPSARSDERKALRRIRKTRDYFYCTVSVRDYLRFALENKLAREGCIVEAGKVYYP